MTKEIKVVRDKKILDEGFSTYSVKIYNYMCFSLIITGVTTIVTISFEPLVNLLFIIGPND